VDGLRKDLAAGVAAALAATAKAFGPPPAAAPDLRWGALYAALDPVGDIAFAVDIELIYEGYLLHYRESRALSLAADDLETRLLAGDCFYARGLRGVAARGDADAVGLLARLMAACSYLRAASASFAGDDTLWAYTTAGLAAQHAGAEPASVAALFDAVEAGFQRERPPDVTAAVAGAVARLSLPDPAPLLRELDVVAGR
jgi:hypothetical protein